MCGSCVFLGPQSIGGQSDASPDEGRLSGGTSRRPGLIILQSDYRVGPRSHCLRQYLV